MVHPHGFSDLIPSTTTLAAGTVGVSSTGAVWSAMSSIPDGALYSLALAALGFFGVVARGYFESRGSNVENRLLRDQVKTLQAQNAAYFELIRPPAGHPVPIP